jgi:hypothetical protein
LVLIHGSASGDGLVSPGRDRGELAQPRVPKLPGSGESIPLPRNLLSGIRMFREAIETPAFNADTCASFLGGIYANLFRASPSHFDIPEMKEHAQTVVHEIFGTKIELRRQLARMESSGSVPASCVDAMRDTMRASLFLSEYIAEQFIPFAPQDRVFSGAAPSLLLNQDFGARLALESGDVLISRGDAFVSGAIARLGDTDGNFSHVALVYIDPRTREIFTVEAHIEIGAVVAPIEKYLTDGKSRSVVLRQKDPKLAAEAARVMFERVKKASASGKNLPYDFAMLMDGKDKAGRPADAALFCSEVASVGYALASEGRLQIPKYRTALRMTNDSFLKSIGIEAKESFAPSDMETESRFEIVAEWRNLRKTQRSRMTDAVITQIYAAMDEKGYVLRNPTGVAIKRDVAYTVRHLPLFGSLLKERLPANMPRSTLGTMFALNQTAEAMLTQLEQANAEKVSQSGFAMTGAEMQAFLRALIDRDREAYLKHRAWERGRGTEFITPTEGGMGMRPEPPKALFHDSFRPAE